MPAAIVQRIEPDKASSEVAANLRWMRRASGDANRTAHRDGCEKAVFIGLHVTTSPGLSFDHIGFRAQFRNQRVPVPYPPEVPRGFWWRS